MKEKRMFAINKMFAGDYLDQNNSQNIGHEIVNLFSDDADENYIYLNPGGEIPKKYDNKIEYVFLTKHYCPGCHELLGIAKVEKQLVHKWKGKLDDNIREQVKNYKDNIKYHGQPICKIYKENHFNGQKEKDNSLYLTFKTEEYYSPKDKKRIFLAYSDYKIKETSDPNTIIWKLPKFKFGHQPLRRYVLSNRDKKAFYSLENLLKRDDLLKKEMPPTVKNEDIENYNKEAFSYLELMEAIDREELFSNLLKSFLSMDDKLLVRFCKTLSKDIEINPKNTDIIREQNASIKKKNYGRIDIYIEDEHNVIIIENKIEAGLSQENQLKNYRKYAESKSEIKNKRKYYFLIAPDDYNKFIPEDNRFKGFKFVKYSDIQKTFEKNKQDFLAEENEEYRNKILLYYEDFIRALSRHGQEHTSSKQLTMEKLFYKRLYQLDKRNK